MFGHKFHEDVRIQTQKYYCVYCLYTGKMQNLNGIVNNLHFEKCAEHKQYLMTIIFTIW